MRFWYVWIRPIGGDWGATGVLLHQFFFVQALEKVTVCDGGVREKPESEKEAGLQELLLIFFKGKGMKGLVFHCFPFSGSVYDIFSLWRSFHGRPGISWSRTGKGNLPPS